MAKSNKSKINKTGDNDELSNEELLFEKTINQIQHSRVILKELNENNLREEYFNKFSKKDVVRWLENPSQFEKQLRNVSRYLYNSSNHYKRLVKYFSNMAVFSIVLKPLDLNKNNINIEEFKACYRKTSNVLNNMNLAHEFSKILDNVFREDIFYGYLYETSNSFYIRKLPPDYCNVRSVVDGTMVISFNFSYFDRYKKKLKMYGSFFEEAYANYRNNMSLKWQDIPSLSGICIKFDESIDYCVPPFAGVFGSLYDLEYYKNLKKSKEKLNNYKLLTLKIPIDDNGKFKIPENKIMKYYKMIDANLSEDVGLALTPMEIKDYNFEKAGQSNIDSVSEAIEQFWNASGVCSLLFSSSKSGSAGISASSEVDSALLYSIYRQFERWLNYRLKNQPTKIKFKVELLNVTESNRSNVIDQYMKLMPIGAPVMSHIMSLLGLQFTDIENMSFLENDVLQLHDCFRPYLSTYTQASNSETGRPQKEDSDLEIEGENSRIKNENNK